MIASASAPIFPLLGASLDRPAEGAALDFPVASLVGWALGSQMPVAGIELRHDGRRFQSVPLTAHRPDLTAAFPNTPWAAQAGFVTQFSVIGARPSSAIEVVAIAGDGSELPIAAPKVTLSGAAVPIVVLLEPGGRDVDPASRVLTQAARPERVLVIGSSAPLGHPGFTPASGRNAVLDDGTAALWLCDGAEAVTDGFLAGAAAALQSRPTAAFTAALDTTGPTPLGIACALSGRGLGYATVFRAAATRAVGGLDDAAPTPVAAQWDLAIRLAEAGHTWVGVPCGLRGGADVVERAGESAVRWLCRKHATLFRAHLKEVLIDRETLVAELLRDNHTLECDLDDGLRPRVAGARRERDRLARKLRRRVREDESRAGEAGRYFGDLHRVAPLSPTSGADRGVRIDRHYIERFLGEHAADIRGSVLVFGEDVAVRRFGGLSVDRCDVFDIDTTNAGATAVGRLAQAPDLLDGPYDCMVLAHVLHRTADPTALLKGLCPLLQPEGVVLASAPVLARRESGCPDEDYWRFSLVGFERILRGVFVDRQIDVTGAGNRAAAIGFLSGLAAEDLPAGALERHDRSAPLVVLARVSGRKE